MPSGQAGQQPSPAQPSPACAQLWDPHVALETGDFAAACSGAACSGVVRGEVSPMPMPLFCPVPPDLPVLLPTSSHGQGRA